MIEFNPELYYYIVHLIILACMLYSLWSNDSSIIIVLCLLLLYALYNKQMSNQVVEQFDLSEWQRLPKDNKLRIQTAAAKKFCNDDYPLTHDQRFLSNNQALVGPPNPKTLEPPIVAPPSLAWDHWSYPQSVHKAINKSTGFDYARSGYAVQADEEPREHFTPQTQQPILTPLPSQPPQQPLPPQPYLNKTYLQLENNHAQLVNHNIPINHPVGTCNVQSQYDAYNKNLYMNTIQPGLYSQTFVTEPAQSNLGISFQHQFQPTIRKKTNDSSVYTYTTEKPTPLPRQHSLMDRSNLYDPRHTGYGPSYRAYEDPMTGRIRFIYDDIDAVAKPAYICRSNIDHWGPQYGPIPTEKPTRQQAHNQYLNDTLQQREELQYRYMNKYNSQVGWQRRTAPIHRRNTAN